MHDLRSWLHGNYICKKLCLITAEWLSRQHGPADLITMPQPRWSWEGITERMSQTQNSRFSTEGIQVHTDLSWKTIRHRLRRLFAGRPSVVTQTYFAAAHSFVTCHRAQCSLLYEGPGETVQIINKPNPTWIVLQICLVGRNNWSTISSLRAYFGGEHTHYLD